MNEQQFYFLYVNVNCITELALRNMAAETANLEVATPPSNSPTHEFADLDFGALDGLDDLILDNQIKSSQSLIPEPWTLGPNLQSETEFDMEVYMDRAYDYEQLLRVRVANHFRNTNIGALHSLLATLPQALPALTARVSGKELTHWLEVYRSEHPGVIELVSRIRELDA